MEDNERLLTIKEYATKVKCTPQAVYKRLSTGLKDYVVELNGKKYIKVEALAEFNQEESIKPLNPGVEQLSQPFSTFLNPEVEELKKAVDNLRADKEAEIERLREEVSYFKRQFEEEKEARSKVEEERRQIEEERRQLFNVNVMLNNKLMMLEDNQEKSEEDSSIIEDSAPIEKEKIGFLKRFFNK